MKNFFKGRGIEDIAHLSLVAIAFYFSCIFAKDMLFGFMVMLLIFEILKPVLMNEGTNTINTLLGKLYVGLSIIIIGLSLLATCSVLINNYSKMLDEMINNKYKSYTKLFEYFSEVTGVDSITITISVFFIFAILLEVGIIVTKKIAVNNRKKRLGEYKKTFVEQFEEYQERLLNQNFNIVMDQIRMQHEQNKNMLLNTNQTIVIEKEKDKKKLLDIDNTVSSKEKEIINKKSNDKDTNNIISFKAKQSNDDNKEKLFTKKDLDIDTIKEYWNYIVENNNNNIVPGYKKVASEIGVTQAEGQRIFNHLKEKGYLKSIGMRSKLVKDKTI
jgi:hypothetical protein